MNISKRQDFRDGERLPDAAWLVYAFATTALLSATPAGALEDVVAEDATAGIEAASEDILVVANSEIREIKVKLDKVPGTASVVLNADVERGRASNAEDVLAFQPGVFAAATSGNSANKISIRGSGLNTFYQGYSLGIKYLYDGLPISGPGGTQEDLLNIAAVNYTEILNGSNAFSYAALSLGGAINFVTHTGRSSPGFFASAEFGSYGHRKFQVSAGGVVSDTDIYASALYNERDGYQRNSPNDGNDFIFNIGHKFSDRLETRFIFRHRRETLFNGSTLTLGQIDADPRQNRLISGRKKPGTTLLVSRTNYTFDDNSVLEFGLAYNNFPLANGYKTVAPQDWHSEDLSVTLRYIRTGDDIFGLKSDTTLALSQTTLIDGDVSGYDLVRGQRVFRQYTKFTGSRDSVASVSNALHFDDRFTLSSGLSLINVRRDVQIERTIRANPTSFPLGVEYSKYYVAPRVGLLFAVVPEVQVFGNVSRSIDPPVTWQMGSTGSPYIRPLKPQKGTTAEAGIRGSASIFEGSLTAYRTWVQDELLQIVILPATPTAEALTANSNASPTIHQGIEAALTARLWTSAAGHSLTLRQAYNFNDFYYRHDPDFGGNRLPSLPDHVYQGEFLFEHATGFYAGLSARVLSGYYVDFANTLRAPASTIWGAKLGYQSPDKRWKAFADFRNIGDKKYVAAAITAYDLKGVDSPNFYPGDGFAVYTGISVRF